MEGACDSVEIQHAHCYASEFEQPEGGWSREPSESTFETPSPGVTGTDYQSQIAPRRARRYLPIKPEPPRYDRFVLAILKMPVVRGDGELGDDEDKRDKPSSEKKEKPDLDPSSSSEEPRMPGTSPHELPKGNPDAEADRKGEKVNFETRSVNNILAKL
jgi:hypothetical protein